MNLRTASLTDIGADEVEELRQIGETLFVERKRGPTPVRTVLGPAVSSMANTLGGWVLLGVRDDEEGFPSEVEGWKPKGRASSQDYIRDLLQGCVDPVPPFAAKTVELHDGKTVGVIRVAESVDVPHIVAPSGSVWTRGQGGKEPVTSHRDLMALTERGQQARASADGRLNGLPLVETTIAATFNLPTTGIYPCDPRTAVVRIAPIIVPETFADAALSRATVARAEDEIQRALGSTGDRVATHVEPFARGVRCTGIQGRGPSPLYTGFDLVLDAGGVAAGRFAWQPLDEGHQDGTTLIKYVRTITRAAASLLAACGALGRCLIRFDYLAADDPSIDFGPQIGTGKRRTAQSIITEQLDLPIDDEELGRIEGRIRRELARECSLAQWEVPAHRPGKAG